MNSMISLNDKEIDILLNGLNCLVDIEQDTVNYTKLYKKLLTKDSRS